MRSDSREAQRRGAGTLRTGRCVMTPGIGSKVTWVRDRKGMRERSQRSHHALCDQAWGSGSCDLVVLFW